MKLHGRVGYKYLPVVQGCDFVACLAGVLPRSSTVYRGARWLHVQLCPGSTHVLAPLSFTSKKKFKCEGGEFAYSMHACNNVMYRQSALSK